MGTERKREVVSDFYTVHKKNYHWFSFFFKTFLTSATILSPFALIVLQAQAWTACGMARAWSMYWFAINYVQVTGECPYLSWPVVIVDWWHPPRLPDHCWIIRIGWFSYGSTDRPIYQLIGWSNALLTWVKGAQACCYRLRGSMALWVWWFTSLAWPAMH